MGNSIENNILKENESFRGMTYGDFLREWLMWLHSSSPIFRGNRHEICYVHGNLSYIYDRETGIRKQAEPFQNRARSRNIFRGDVIFDDTPIFVPARSSFYSVGEVYYQDNRKLESIADCQYICRRDLNEGGPSWCRVQKIEGDKVKDTNLDQKLCYVETPSFEMTVTQNSPLREHLEMPIKPGTYPTFTAANALMIKSLSEGKYRLQYGGYGRGNYFSDSMYDFIVKPAESTKQSIARIYESITVPTWSEEEYHLDQFKAGTKV